MKKLMQALLTLFVVVSIFLALFDPSRFADFWVWIGVSIGNAIMALLSKIPQAEPTATALLILGGFQ